MERKLRFVNTNHADLCMLVRYLDQYFHENWGAAADNYQQYHDLTKMSCAVVAYQNAAPVGCGCWKAFDAVTAEIKRMFVLPAHRRSGVAAAVLHALEQHAVQQGCHTAVLETGKDMPGAIAFYQAQGYQLIPNYGDFIGDAVCVCMKKEIADEAMR